MSYFADLERKIEPSIRKDALRKRGTSPKHLTFEMREYHKRLRASQSLRQTAHHDSIRLREQILASMKQNDMRTEMEYIQGLSSRMNPPPHLRTRLEELKPLM